MRASRSAHERRAWARCARERITSALRGEAAGGGGRLTSMRWCRTSCIQARRCSLRLPSRKTQGRGTNAERMEQETDPRRRAWWLPHSIDTACAKGSHDSRVSWHWRARADCHRLGGAERRGRHVLPSGQCSSPSGWRARVPPRETTRFPGQGNRRLARAWHRPLFLCGLFDGRSKLGRAHRSGLKQRT